MEAHELAAGQKSSNKNPVKQKGPLQRKWASEPSANVKRSTFTDQEVKYAVTGNSAKLLSGPSVVGAIGGPPSQDPQGSFAQGFPRGYAYQLGQPYPQHPQTERFVSGAKPQPGLEPHAWPFAGQLPSEDCYPVVQPGHTHPHGGGRFPRQKSPSLPSSFGQYSQSSSEPGDEGYGKKDQKPKKPGRYICHYCGRACAKPSVLKKHIRSHTGERPYPCVPCGFSFKTKSNLYKHRKSHAHAIKAGLVPFSSELAATRTGDMDQSSTEVPSDGEQSTDTDEEGVEGSTMLTDKSSPIPQISFEADRNAGGGEPAYADSAEELSVGSMKVPILIFHKPGGVPPTGMECPPFHDIKGSHRMLASQAGGRAHSLDDSPSIKQRLALRLNEKKGQDFDPVTSQSLNLLSPHSKGSTDSGYFSPYDSAELQISTPNTNAKTYEEIMFGRTWYNRPNSRARQPIVVGMAGPDPTTLASLKQTGAISEMEKIAEDHISFRGNLGICGDAKHYPTGPCQSSTGLLEPPSDSSQLFRSNSMPTPSPPTLGAPPAIRGSVSFDNMAAPDDVFYPPGHPRLKRQGAFEHSANEAHVGEAENYGHSKNLVSSMAIKIGERSTGIPEHVSYSPHGTKVSMSEIATRKRRKEKSVGDDEDSPGHCDSSCSGSVEMMGDYEFKQGSLDGKASLHSAPSQSDSFDTCASMCSEDMAPYLETDGRKAAGNVISVIQHTNSLSRPNSFDKSESFEQPASHPSDKASPSHYSEQSDTDIYEDAVSNESGLVRVESMEHQLQNENDSISLSSSGQQYPKLVRQPNIQVPEIRVTPEETSEKDAEIPVIKEPEKQEKHVEEFQLPQRSDTLSQMPAEKLPPKKKRLRLADMEHSSGESSFESACTSLSRSPSQESNLSHSSSLSMSFDRDEGPKSTTPNKQDDWSLVSGGGPKPSEFLTVPGSNYSGQHQQREMRRSSSEQAPCTLPAELTEMRSKSFDYGNLPSSRQGELYASASAKKERRRGYLVRQASLSVYPEAAPQEPGGLEMSIKQESLEVVVGSHSNAEFSSKTRKGCGGISGSNHQHSLQQSISEDSLQDEPFYGRSQQHRLQAQGSSSEGEYPGHEVLNKDFLQQYHTGSSLISFPQPGLFWSPESTSRPQQTLQAQQQLQKLHIKSSGFSPQKQIHDPAHPNSFPSRSSPLSQQLLGSASSSASPVLLKQNQTVFATQNQGSQSSLNSQGSLPSLLVPVRIQTHVPSFGSAMYTSVSQLISSHTVGQALGLDGGCMSPPETGNISESPRGGLDGSGFNLSLLLGKSDGLLLRYPPRKSQDSLPEQRINTGIPLSLTSGTISTTDASGSGIGGGKRMLSPTNSLELILETKQQKRVKEERMFGQIVKEMSAVELSGTETGTRSEKPGESSRIHLKSQESTDDSLSSRSKMAIPVRSSAPQRADVPPAESFTPPLQIVTERSPGGRDSPEELDVDDAPPETSSSPEPMMSSDAAEDIARKSSPVQLPVCHKAGMMTQQVFQFPSLHTICRVTWCFRSHTKPCSTPAALRSSVYGSWSVSSYNPNPMNLNTKTAIALLRSKQKNANLVYTVAAMSPQDSLVLSKAWKLRFGQMKPVPGDAGHFGKRMKRVASWERWKEEQMDKEISVKQAGTEPTRVKIFEGGYKSNEDYVYVRGRGRGKYICEECGIRCKKPSMLKKHIRTHTDVRPFVCKFCNFAFKTKGNLTKHMKSKAHMKKCLELGVSTSSVEDTEGDDDVREDGQKSSDKASRGITLDHQFSDADDSEGGEEDGDEVDDEDEDDEEYDGDSTPKTLSRSTSPQPCGLPSMSITAVAASHHHLLGHAHRPPLFGYFTTVPSIQITPQAPPPDLRLQTESQRQSPGNRLLVPPSSSMDEDLPVSSPELSLPSSRLSSPGLDLSGSPSPISPSSSPSARRYLSPRRDLSPRPGPLSPRRDVSPLRHVSPKRDAAAGGFRRELSPRRPHLSVVSPLSRTTSPGRRDYRRELSPGGGHRGMIRHVSPRRGSHSLSQRSGRSHRTSHPIGSLGSAEFPAGAYRSGTEMEMEHRLGPALERDPHPGPSHQVLFSHLPLHSQIQVRSPFPMIPIGGIQMVQSVPSGARGVEPATSRLALQKEDGASSRLAEPGDRGGAVRERGRGGAEPEEGVQVCTEAIASLCIDTEQPTGRAKGEEDPASASSSHFSSPEFRPAPLSPRPHRPASNSFHPPSKPARCESEENREPS